MQRIILAILVFSFSLATAHAADPKARQAAEQMLKALNMQQVMEQSIDKMVEVQMQQNPSMVPYRQVMTDFLKKYMSYPQIKDELITIYTDEFTTDELRTLTRFYQTPTGRKAIAKLPILMAKGAQLGASRVQAQVGELQAAIAAESQRLQALDKQVTPSDADAKGK